MQPLLEGAALESTRRIFISRLDGLRHIVERGASHLGDRPYLAASLAPDMLPLGTQIAFACNQPRNFARWLGGEEADNLPPEVPTLELAHRHLADTRALLEAARGTDALLRQVRRIGLGPGLFCELSGERYVSEFLLPNFYFHITITYALFRQLGVPLGKADYMHFLVPYVQRETDIEQTMSR